MTREIIECDLRLEIPEECNITLEHAKTHLDSALDSDNVGAMDEVAHDIDMVLRILSTWIEDRGKDWPYCHWAPVTREDE